MAELRRDVLDVARELGIDVSAAARPGMGGNVAGPAGESASRVDPAGGVDVRASTPFRLLRAARALERAVRPAGEPGSSVLLLEIGRGGILQSRLPGALGVHRSTVSELVGAAVRKGLVRRRRHGVDGRRRVLELTVEGRRRAEAAAARWRAVDARLLGKLTAAERDELRRLLRKAAAALDRGAPGP